MSYLLDTNIISQPSRPTPDQTVMAWLGAAEEEKIFLSVITIEEIREGIELLPEGKRKRSLDTWLSEGLATRFAGRILPVNEVVADRCGCLAAACRKKGFNPEAMDVLIAATALVHGLAIVTLNRKHFERFGVELLRF